jgi:hypothetical protein
VKEEEEKREEKSIKVGIPKNTKKQLLSPLARRF